MSTTPPVPTTLFIGATGGCTNSTLIHALRSQTHCIALVRTPSKLTSQLQAQSIPDSTLSTYLTIIPGNGLSVADVKRALTPSTPGHVVTHIVSGIGTRPVFRWNTWRPWECVVMEQPDVCARGAQTLVDASRELRSEREGGRMPKLTFVSNTGVSDGPEDVPWGLRWFYHYVLYVPHEDKRMMERVYRENRAVFGGVVCIRPTLLVGSVDVNDGKGWGSVRAGRHMQPALGYTVSRADVGEWMWVNVVGSEERRREWEGENVSLTY